jgi:hypothetical protein
LSSENRKAVVIDKLRCRLPMPIPMPMPVALISVCDEGDETGFIYSTNNVETHGQANEFLALDVPVSRMEDVAQVITFLSAEQQAGTPVLDGHTVAKAVRSNATIHVRIEQPSEVDTAAFFESHLCQAAGAVDEPCTKQLFLLVPFAHNPDDPTQWGSKELAMAMNSPVGALSVGPRAVCLARAPAPPIPGDDCFVRNDQGMTLLSRTLPSGRVINIDTGENGIMMRGGLGIANLDMNNGNFCASNLAIVNEQTARKMLMDFSE